MTVEPRFENPHPARERSTTMAMVAILTALIAIGLSAYIYTSEGNQLSTINSQTTTLTSNVQQANVQMITLESKISDLNTKIAALNATLARIIEGGNTGGGTPQTNGLTAEQIYNQTANSIVLIKVHVSNGTDSGSGFVYDTSGRIVTNNHVITGALNGGITVTFLNGTIVPATQVGTDPYSDVAVIKVTAPTALLKPLKIGISSKLIVGDTVYAVGNPFELTDTMTEGIISAVGRELDEGAGYLIVDVLQTDAALNPGNSGGPLFNSNGEVVGMNTAGATSTSSGVNFAVPSDTITREVPSLISTGSYSHLYLGISGYDVTPGVVSAMNLLQGTYDTLIISVVPGGPSDKAGLRGGTNTAIVDGAPLSIGGDVITGADGHPLKFFYNLMVYIERNKKPGDTITLNILRNNTPSNIVVTLGVRPPPG
ncbi:MAG: trypsin-like peptidase domain-containing protein [Candidatus Bathyarchaeia archaeon]|jgi:S1-C subfamily serine protease